MLRRGTELRWLQRPWHISRHRRRGLGKAPPRGLQLPPELCVVGQGVLSYPGTRFSVRSAFLSILAALKCTGKSVLLGMLAGGS